MAKQVANPNMTDLFIQRSDEESKQTVPAKVLKQQAELDAMSKPEQYQPEDLNLNRYNTQEYKDNMGIE